MEPLQLTEGVVTHHHRLEGGTSTVAILGLIGVIVPVALLYVPLAGCCLLAFFPVLLLNLVHSPLTHFLLQLFSGLMDEGIQFLRNGDLLVAFILDGGL